jgi:hypothetical protein
MKAVFLVLQTYVALAATIFALVYHVTARWWETAMGQNIMLLIGSIALVLDLGLASNLLGRPAWIVFVYLAAFAAIGTAIWWRLFILLDAQYRTKSKGNR